MLEPSPWAKCLWGPRSHADEIDVTHTHQPPVLRGGGSRRGRQLVCPPLPAREVVESEARFEPNGPHDPHGLQVFSELHRVPTTVMPPQARIGRMLLQRADLLTNAVRIHFYGGHRNAGLRGFSVRSRTYRKLARNPLGRKVLAHHQLYCPTHSAIRGRSTSPNPVSKWTSTTGRTPAPLPYGSCRCTSRCASTLTPTSAPSPDPLPPRPCPSSA